MRNHQLDGIAVQNPMRIGYLGVQTMVAHLRGQKVERRIDTGVTLVTPENLDAPETKAVVNPPVGRYLTGG
jgi:ribose transport system substrate-binding protein